VDRILFIKEIQKLGFSLRELKEILDFKVNSKAHSVRIVEQTNLMIRQINQQVKELGITKQGALKLIESLKKTDDDKTTKIDFWPSILFKMVEKKKKE
jgi:DNA-binding transcriptional MerR regulator